MYLTYFWRAINIFCLEARTFLFPLCVYIILSMLSSNGSKNVLKFNIVLLTKIIMVMLG